MYKIVLLLLIVVSILSGCSMDKQKIINRMVPDSGEHSLYIFSKFMSVENKDKLTNDLLEFVNDKETQKNLDIRKTQFINLEDENAKGYVKALGIKETPWFVLLDKKEIILQTNDINQILNYLNEK